MLFKLPEKPLQTFILVCHISFRRLHIHLCTKPSALSLHPAQRNDVWGIQARSREYLTVPCPKIDVEHLITLMGLKFIL